MRAFTIASIATAAAAYQTQQQDSQFLAQTEAEKMTGNNCLTAIKRNKGPVEDFWTLVKGTTQWKDTDFTADTSAFAWTDFGEKSSFPYSAQAHWVRALNYGAGYSLLGDGATADDVIQGEIGNCWFLAATSAIADTKPGLLEKTFLNTDKALNKAGVYAVTMYPLGVPKTVVIDDRIPRVTFDQTVTLNGMA